MPDILEAPAETEPEMTQERICRICGQGELETFFDAAEIPVQLNVLWSKRAEALECTKGHIRLAFCRKCGCIRNVTFEPELLRYDVSYENSLHFSPVFQEYAQALAIDLVGRYDLHGKVVVEIGCGKGEFLAMLCELGNNAGVGFDPAYADGRGSAAAGKGIKFVTQMFPGAGADAACDFVCCRHVLEHVGDPRELLLSIRRSAGRERGPVVYFEVPNAMFTLQGAGMWDVIYPHCSYFSRPSLRSLFTSCGFEVLTLREGFAGQYLSIEAVPRQARAEMVSDNGAQLDAVQQAVTDFAEKYRKKTEELGRALDLLRSSRKRAVLWGAGAKGMMFLNKFRNLAAIDYVVDVNPHKHWKFVSGSGQEIVAPEFLKEYRPDVIFLANLNYREEIGRQVRDLGLEPTFTSI